MDDHAKPLTIAARIDFLAKNDGRFRVKQVYNRKVMPGMDYDIACDGDRFQLFDRTALRLTISKKPTLMFYGIQLPNVLFEPLQFLGGDDNRHPPFNVRWEDIMDADRTSKCLGSAVVDEETIDNRSHTVILLPGGRMDGKAFRYRVFVDGPEGRPNRIDRIAQNGDIITTATFEYGRYRANSATVLLPKHMTLAAFDEHGAKAMESDVRVSQLDLNPIVPEGAFTIDFRDADVVFDNDAKVEIKSASPGSRPSSPG